MTETNAQPADKSAEHLANLASELATLHAEITEEATALVDHWGRWIRRPAFRPAAQNLACHLALRRRDLRALQDELSRFGLSSLRHSESRVAESLIAVSALISRAAGLPPERQPALPSRTAFGAGALRLADEANRVFGPPSALRPTRIMVTLPPEAAGDTAYIAKLLARGVEVVRINAAVGDLDIWRALITTLRNAETQSGPPGATRVLLDLAGPRIRTTLFEGNNDRRRVCVGESFWLARAPSDGPAGAACLGCSVPEVIGQLHFGDPVWIADGELGGHVVERMHGAVRIEVTHAPEDGKRLKADKGLRFPATELAIPALTPQDVETLAALAPSVDIIGLPFVQGVEDVTRLHDTLSSLGLRRAQSPALMIRIETRRALRNLPEIIVAAAGQNPSAILIARGDLAVEMGHLRLSEIQDDIFALCEAAGVPVVWTAPVLKELARRGEPTRGDIADALMGIRAACIMLNRGEHALAATDILIELLRRKATPPQRVARTKALQSWQSLFAD